MENAAASHAAISAAAPTTSGTIGLLPSVASHAVQVPSPVPQYPGSHTQADFAVEPAGLFAPTPHCAHFELTVSPQWFAGHVVEVNAVHAPLTNAFHVAPVVAQRQSVKPAYCPPVQLFVFHVKTSPVAMTTPVGFRTPLSDGFPPYCLPWIMSQSPLVSMSHRLDIPNACLV